MNRRICCAWVLLALYMVMRCIAVAEVAADPSTIVDVGDQAQLFIDGQFIRSVDRIQG